MPPATPTPVAADPFAVANQQTAGHIGTYFNSALLDTVLMFHLAPVVPHGGKLRRRSELTKLKLSAKINSLGVVLTENGKKLAQFAIIGTKADLQMKDNTLAVAVRISFLCWLFCLLMSLGLPRFCSTH